MKDGFGRICQKPQHIDQHLNTSQAEGKSQLGLRRDKTRSFGSSIRRVEDSRDSIGLGQKSAIHYRKAQTNAELLDGTNPESGSNDE